MWIFLSHCTSRARRLCIYYFSLDSRLLTKQAPLQGGWGNKKVQAPKFIYGKKKICLIETRSARNTTSLQMRESIHGWGFPPAPHPPAKGASSLTPYIYLLAGWRMGISSWCSHLKGCQGCILTSASL